MNCTGIPRWTARILRKTPVTNKDAGVEIQDQCAVIDRHQIAVIETRLDKQAGLVRVDFVVSESDKRSHTVRPGRDAISAVQFSQALTAEIDAWAEARHLTRGDAIRSLVQLGLKFVPATTSHHSVQQEASTIEGEAAGLISALLDPSLPAEERERRIRRLIEGPPEFAEQRIDLPKHEK